MSFPYGLQNSSEKVCLTKIGKLPRLKSMFLRSIYSCVFFCSFIFSFLFCAPDFSSSQNKEQSLQKTLGAFLLADGWDVLEETKSKIGALPARSPGSESDTEATVNLGRKIFSDRNLSLNQIQSCTTCHILDGRQAGTDGQSVSRGTFGQIGRRNAPSILNVGYLKVLFWDGRKSSLEEQAVVPFLDPLEMALPSEAELLNRLNADSQYADLFKAAFPGSPSVSIASLRIALSAFQRTLITPSRFDDFANGNINALNYYEKRGLRTFLNLGCTNCHEGYMLGGSQFKKLDTVYSYNPNDQGRYEFTGKDEDKKFFRVPSLRNVTLTAPYFHDGSVRNLEAAIARMNHYEAPREISASEITEMISFLKSLSDKNREN
ncbi:cytochrome-c peroxidase [Leptospira idonii]|uniref:Cytochrome-c peroxidase n=1 Tax=Leptospira idonii TaxID=1193500 RepID=A0A4R9LU95_9LEPT|nr:cytochrome-c peroxidase [Leptospira idonii]